MSATYFNTPGAHEETPDRLRPAGGRPSILGSSQGQRAPQPVANAIAMNYLVEKIRRTPATCRGVA
jgi:hypothetical protein